MSDKTAIPQLNDFEDDDEFEDFGAESWDPRQSNSNDAMRWLEDWDSEMIEDDFTRQLRAELQKANPPATPAGSSERKDDSMQQ
ncbi:26S proteasome complex subunit SEM1 [Chytriomyces hyalinus]|nr:hypothetical protein BJ741DRAFT_622065 [Chytriomyces cf. hyalinus JEL632]KAJ3233557.1 26S proteasome complex subunit SEM1 [Chytriomyces hyalinus]KAJ3257308.1 26S proteasome complex subunit SEM1 [Chytriomyces hyalinus]KAJ3407972.1 26S proteasome complex subunit SEM1 [Chytriomyces hyalinus]